MKYVMSTLAAAALSLAAVAYVSSTKAEEPHCPAPLMMHLDRAEDVAKSIGYEIFVLNDESAPELPRWIAELDKLPGHGESGVSTGAEVGKIGEGEFEEIMYVLFDDSGCVRKYGKVEVSTWNALVARIHGDTI